MKKILLILFIAGTLGLFAQEIRTKLVYKVKKPALVSSKTPVLIMLHGYGSNEDDLFALANSFDSRFLTFSLRAPYPANGQGFSWCTLEFLPEKKFRYDYQQTKESRNKIMSFISNACKAYNADSTQVFVMGFSQGAIMAFDLAFSKPDKIKGVLALSGFLLEETKKLSSGATTVAKVKFFIGHGNMDNVVDYNKGVEAAAYLKDKKAEVTFNSYDMPHAINGKELNDIKSWLAGQLGKEKSEKKKDN